MPSGNRLDVIATEWMATGLYYRVHPTLHPANPSELLSSLAANPASTARLALRGNAELGVGARAMFYVATSPAAALFEALLRGARMYPGRRVVVPWHLLKGQTLSTVRLLTPQPYVPLMKPERGLVVQDAGNDAAWQWTVNTPHHKDTHGSAAEVAAQFAQASPGPDGAPLVLPGFGYPSIQFSGENVFLLYDPPMKIAAWSVEERVNLNTPEGYHAVSAALAAGGLSAIEQPAKLSGHDFDPPSGAV